MAHEEDRIRLENNIKKCDKRLQDAKNELDTCVGKKERKAIQNRIDTLGRVRFEQTSCLMRLDSIKRKK